MDRLAKFRAMARRVRTSTTVALWVCTLASIGLFIGSFMVPPLGAIDPSVLKGGAALFAFAALFVAREAVMEGLGVKVSHGQTTIEVHDLDGQPSANGKDDGDTDSSESV